MSPAFPDLIDPWRMVQARRIFEGSLSLKDMPRLCEGLAECEGKIAYTIEFGTDSFGIAFLDLHVEGDLPMTCQREFKAFPYAIRLDQRLGLIHNEADEAGLSEEYEALLVSDNQLRLHDVIEDELILALPVVALSPGVPLEEEPVGLQAPPEEDVKPHPFAVLGKLKSPH